jgi:hypothetical protein
MKRTIIILVEESDSGFNVAQVMFGTVPVDNFGISYGVFRIMELDLTQVTDNTFYVALSINLNGSPLPSVDYTSPELDDEPFTECRIVDDDNIILT